MTDLGPLPKVHPRDAELRTARLEMATHISDVVAARRLTRKEAIMVIAELLHEEISFRARALVQQERHTEETA